MDSIKKVEAYYDDDVLYEWQRLERCPIEYGVTLRYMERYYDKGAKVLDVGGGPGRYAIHLAKQGHDVTLVDLSAGNVAFAKEQAKRDGVHIKAIHGNALHLDQHIDETYDIVQCMGPLYHLLEEKDRMTCIEQCLKRLKKGGLFVAAFISSYAVINDHAMHDPKGILVRPHAFKDRDKDIAYVMDPEDPGFIDAFFIHPSSIKPLMASFELEPVAIAGVEGVAGLHEPAIKEAGQETLDAWIDLAYRYSQDELTWAASMHFLYLGRKRL